MVQYGYAANWLRRNRKQYGSMVLALFVIWAAWLSCFSEVAGYIRMDCTLDVQVGQEECLQAGERLKNVTYTVMAVAVVYFAVLALITYFRPQLIAYCRRWVNGLVGLRLDRLYFGLDVLFWCLWVPGVVLCLVFFVLDWVPPQLNW